MASTDMATGRNHPLAFRMAVIAGINQNIGIACAFGSFSALLVASEARLGVGRELSTLAIAALNLMTAICAPFVGALAVKRSLRLVLLSGSILGTLGFILLACTASFPFYLAAYGLLIGPGMAASAILPSALVTRWYSRNRGRALGIICAPIVISAVPPLTMRMVEAYGLPATYCALAALSAVSIVANVFIVDHPPASPVPEGEARPAQQSKVQAGETMRGLLRTPRFWALIFTFIGATNGMVILTSHMVPMVKSWGIPATLAATLLSVQYFSGACGTVIFGWVTDRIGSAKALAFIMFSSAILWALLLLEPDFAFAAVIVGLIGLLGSGVMPSLGVALSEAFGRDNFSRAYGLCNLINLPFSVLCVPAAAMIFARTGSYAGAMIDEAIFLAAIGLALLFFVPFRARRADGVRVSLHG